MAKWKATLSYEVTHFIEADSYDEAMDKVDHSEMNYEFIYGHRGGDFNLEKVEED